MPATISFCRGSIGILFTSWELLQDPYGCSSDDSNVLKLVLCDTAERSILIVTHGERGICD